MADSSVATKVEDREQGAITGSTKPNDINETKSLI